MSIATATVGGPAFQPYQCRVCHRRFTRHENLKRHGALHSRPRKADALSCIYCYASFSRSDLRTRHMRRKHPEQYAAEWAKGTKQRSGGRSNGCLTSSVTSQTVPESPEYPELPSLESPAPGRTECNDQADSWQAGGIGVNNNPPNSTPGSSLTEDDDDLDDVSGRGPESGPHTGLPSIRRQFRQSQHELHDHFQTLLHPDLASQSTGSPDHIEPERLRLGSFSRFRTFSFDHSLSNFDFGPSEMKDNWLPSRSQNYTGTNLYFTHVSHFVPFLHQPTYDASTTPDYLRLAMLCLAFQYGEDPDRSYDERSGTILSVRCYHRSRALIALAEDNSSSLNDSSRIRAMVQTYLLLEIFAMFYLPSKGSNNGYSSGTDIAPTDMCHVQSPLKSNGNEPAQTSTDGTAMHARLIALARVGGLMQPLPVQATPTHDLHSLWMQFVRNESHKRTLFAVHQLDALWYQLLSIPRSISHLEIKHELPCPEDYWIAPSADQWAHRKLMSGSIRGTGDRFPVSYAEAVRRFLSSDGETDVVLPPFDAYGAINIAQFLISSAREISGWSTITGVLSLERLQPLKSSLIALSPAIHPEPETSKATHAGLMCEAIWEIAMIELQLWSPAHTDGIVRGSIEDLLRQSTQLPPPLSRFLYETTTIQPHIDWFLQYLEASVSPNLEAPWIPLYAYKAFLIAYQLVCEGIPGSMRVVGVQDSDVEGALLWAKKVFHRRRHWHLGQVILDCLSKLDKPEI